MNYLIVIADRSYSCQSHENIEISISFVKERKKKKRFCPSPSSHLKKRFFFKKIEVQHTSCIYINHSCESWFEKIILDRMELHFKCYPSLSTLKLSEPTLLNNIFNGNVLFIYFFPKMYLSFCLLKVSLVINCWKNKKQW